MAVEVNERLLADGPDLKLGDEVQSAELFSALIRILYGEIVRSWP